jgi:hypothetical protein
MNSKLWFSLWEAGACTYGPYDNGLMQLHQRNNRNHNQEENRSNSVKNDHLSLLMLKAVQQYHADQQLQPVNVIKSMIQYSRQIAKD